MAVDRADVVEAELLEQRGRHHHALGVFLKAFGQLEQRRRGLEHLFGAFLGGSIKTPAHELRQVAVEGPHGRADRHVVVVQDHQQLAVLHAGMVEGLESHASRHGPIADHGNRMAALTLLTSRQGHAQRSRNAGGRVAHAKGVVFAFVAARKARQAIELAK